MPFQLIIWQCTPQHYYSPNNKLLSVSILKYIVYIIINKIYVEQNNAILFFTVNIYFFNTGNKTPSKPIKPHSLTQIIIVVKVGKGSRQDK